MQFAISVPLHQSKCDAWSDRKRNSQFNSFYFVFVEVLNHLGLETARRWWGLKGKVGHRRRSKASVHEDVIDVSGMTL
jgi:hypothetical protein